MAKLDNVTIRRTSFKAMRCENCCTLTMHLVGKGMPTVCLQCLVDVHDVPGWSRWIDPATTQRLNDPRGLPL